MIKTEKGCTNCQGTGYEILADLFCLIYTLKKNEVVPFPLLLAIILEAVHSESGKPEGLETLFDDDKDRGLPN